LNKYAHKELSELTKEQLLEYARELQMRVGKFASVEQQLINIRDRLDAEVVIHKQMNAFNERAFRVNESNAFFQLVAESVLDIFEFEFGIAIQYQKGQDETMLFVSEGINIPQLAHQCFVAAFEERFETQPERKVIQLNKGDWPEMHTLIPFNQFIVAHAVNSEDNAGIYVAGGILEKGALNYRAIEPPRVNAFELFSKQVVSHFSSHQKTFRIEKSESRLTALANTFLGFGSVPLQNISNITALAFDMLAADLVFYKHTGRDEPVVFFRSENIDGNTFTEDGDLDLYYRSLSFSEQETIVSNNHRYSRYLINKRDENNESLAISHLIRNDGQLTGMLGFFFSSKVKVTQEDLQIIGIIGSAISVEEKRQIVRNSLISKNDELSKINGELDNFVYSVSHDLRTPLLAVKGLVNLIDLYQGDINENEDFFKLIVASIDRMDNTIIEILDYSRNARLQVRPELVELDKIIRNAFEDVRFYSNNPVKLELIIHEGIKFESDRNRLNTVIKNLIGNAVKYADESKPHSYVKVNVLRQGLDLLVEISDNGIGIEPCNLEKVFEMFFRASEKTTGTGLGLYISKEIMIKLNGNIKLDSEVGKGTTAKISLPVIFLN
jgi:signal transduction histidine kinase